jgi:hypothetical protein
MEENCAVFHHAIAITWQAMQKARGAYGTVQHAVALVSAFLNMVLEGGRIQRFQKFERAEKFAGN